MVKFSDIFGNKRASALNKVYPYRAHQSYEVFIKVNELEKNTTSMVMFWITYMSVKGIPTLSASANIPLPDGVEASQITGVGHECDLEEEAGLVVGGHYVDDEENLPDLTEEQKNEVNIFFSAQDPVSGILGDLLMCHQVKALRNENIANYFRKLRSESVNARALIRIMDCLISRFDPIAPEMKERISNDLFLKYHTSASSSPALCNRVISELSDIGKAIFSPEDIHAVEQANAATWSLELSLKIPDRVKALVHAYMEATGSLPDNWYQGAKARDTIPAAEYKVTVVLFKHLSSKMFEADRALLFSKIPDIVNSLPQTMRRGGEYKLDEYKESMNAYKAKQAEIDAATLKSVNAKRQQTQLPLLTELPDDMKIKLSEVIKLMDAQE